VYRKFKKSRTQKENPRKSMKNIAQFNTSLSVSGNIMYIIFIYKGISTCGNFYETLFYWRFPLLKNKTE